MSKDKSRVYAVGEPVLAYQSSADSKGRVLLKALPRETRWCHIKHYADGQVIITPMREKIQLTLPEQGDT